MSEKWDPAITPKGLNLHPHVPEPKTAADATWGALEYLSLDDGAVRHAVVAVERGYATREQALITLVFHYRNAHAALVRDRIEELSMKPSAPVVLMRE